MRNRKMLFIPLLLIMVLVISGCGKKEFKVTFNSDGGSNVQSQEVKKNGNLEEPAKPKKEGYKFLGWFDGDNEWDFSKEITADVKLIAKWEKLDDGDEISTDIFNVKFNSDGGSTVSGQAIKKDGKLIKPTNPTKSGYTFVAWKNGTEVWNFDQKVTKDMTLVAEWKTDATAGTDKPVASTKITVTFNSNGGSAVPKQIINKGSLIKKPTNPTRSGYTFIGWFNGNTQWNFNWATNIDITLVAGWKRVEEVKPDPKPEQPKSDVYTLQATTVDDYSPTLLIKIFKNGQEVTNSVKSLKVGNSILGLYSDNTKTLIANKAQYESNKNNELTIIMNDGSSNKINK